MLCRKSAQDTQIACANTKCTQGLSRIMLNLHACLVRGCRELEESLEHGMWIQSSVDVKLQEGRWTRWFTTKTDRGLWKILHGRRLQGLQDGQAGLDGWGCCSRLWRKMTLSKAMQMLSRVMSHHETGGRFSPFYDAVCCVRLSSFSLQCCMNYIQEHHGREPFLHGTWACSQLILDVFRTTPLTYFKNMFVAHVAIVLTCALSIKLWTSSLLMRAKSFACMRCI